MCVFTNHVFEKYAKANGVVELNGTEIAICQTPYIDGHSEVHFKARGVDHKLNEYEVRWRIKDEYESIPDEEDCCDWSDYKVRKV